MGMNRILYTLALILIWGGLLGQGKTFVVGGEPIDDTRYKEMKGNPLLFKDWVPVIIKDTKGEAYESTLVNFNGLTSHAEVTSDRSSYILCDEVKYPWIIVRDIAAKKELDLEFMEELVFVQRPGRKFSYPSDYYLELYVDDAIKLYMEFTASESTITQNIPGKTIEVQKIRRNQKLLLISSEGIKRFSTSKKEVRKALSEYGDIKKWAKANKMKYDSYEGIVGFLSSRE